jgi:hypothetical protein
VRKEFLAGLSLAVLSLTVAGCRDGGINNNKAEADMVNANANLTATTTANNMNGDMMANTGTMETGTNMPAPDDSSVMMTREGEETREVRRFNNPASRVERVEVVTRGGKRTARVYYRDATVKDLPESRIGEALTATGDALGDAGGYVADKTKAAASKTGEVVGDAAGEVRDASGRVISKTADVTKDAGSKVVEGTKTVGSKAVEGTKAAGSKAAELGREGGNIVVDGAKKVGEGAKDVGKGTVKGAKKVGSTIKDAVTP